MTVPTMAHGGDAALDELEASFLSCEGAPDVQAALALLPAAELEPPDGFDDRAMMPTVRTRSTRCC